ncbi:MAG TPA: class I SAM-dependent methyltransferase [Gammaproteobacteria bacterium]|jgi:cyclopropane fatty-acyl-phospholipid synthase-like methyltransferase|nr:class I SAM-dependent methyltransferase [Gammaproteobacteria bacterium]
MTGTSECEIQAFFEGWQLYQQVIAGNYMMHVNVISELETVLADCYKPGLTVLELGCGDAHVLHQALRGRRIAHYLGIDLSAPALDFARDRLDSIVDDLRLYPDTMANVERYAERRYDLIIAGYSLHHLRQNEKRSLLGLLHTRLADGGELFVYDVFRDDDETRAAYLERGMRCFRERWSSLSEEQLDRVARHVMEQDHPESRSGWEQLIADAGFSGCDWRLDDPDRLFAVARSR